MMGSYRDGGWGSHEMANSSCLKTVITNDNYIKAAERFHINSCGSSQLITYTHKGNCGTPIT